MKSEADGSSVLNSTILIETEYQIQHDTLILWHDAESSMDLALSFQEQTGCFEIMQQITEIQARLAADSNDIDQINSANSMRDSMDDQFSMFLDEDFVIPEPSIANLEQVEHTFIAAVKLIGTRDTLLTKMLNTDFIEKFIELLEQCEDLEMVQECFRLATIVKCLFFLNSHAVYEILLQDPYFLILVGMLEYDREYPNCKAYYREYFQKQVKFKQVREIAHPAR